MDPHWLVQGELDYLFQALVKCGGEEHGLSLLVNQADDFLDLVLESEVQEFIGLIENEHFEVVQIDIFGVGEDVYQPSWGGNDEIRPLPHIGFLGLDRGLAEYNAGRQICVPVQRLEHLVALDREFSRRQDDKSPRKMVRKKDGLLSVVSQREVVLDLIVSLDDRDQECGCFAGSCNTGG